MTDRAIFAAIVDRIFGTGSATFDITVSQSNHVIGALANNINFSSFNNNFEARLKRLNAAILIDPSLSREVLAAVNRIADAGWDGAYAELVALDYFLNTLKSDVRDVLLDRTVPATETLASEMGMQNANHDMSFPNLNVSMDAKLLSDKTGDILKGIFKDFCSAKGINNLVIVPSYDLDSDFTQYAINRQALLNELINSVDPEIKPPQLTSKVISRLSYRFAWSAGVYFGESSYSPIEHALQHHALLFGHAKKFSRYEKSVIVFVIFPWSGEKVFPFEDTKRTFFKLLGDHFFNDYLGSTDLASKYNQKFKSSILAGDVTRYLSGIVYLEDNAITGNTPGQLNIDASYHWNKNAIHPLHGTLFETRLNHNWAFNLNT